MIYRALFSLAIIGIGIVFVVGVWTLATVSVLQAIGAEMAVIALLFTALFGIWDEYTR
jgi:hypothetical membrane protein